MRVIVLSAMGFLLLAIAGCVSAQDQQPDQQPAAPQSQQQDQQTANPDSANTDIDHDRMLSTQRQGDDRYPVCSPMDSNNHVDVSTGKWVGPSCQMEAD
ncbi:hypothetical protein G6N74_24080 [Mesorhizobium sp. CGMCC 1.15528]|uniref:Secreted protein n=1 Tax=Mesorhizobium zhangyense TaxID=1776730 RepID=A0A7C9VG34_9HYPH|nr:hypothetical protein [Mesorhizobium zhangyense]NGN44152.1 hypothetical protein [Mesorhizobium zhangyense]